MLEIHRDWLNSLRCSDESKAKRRPNHLLVISDQLLDPNRQWEETPAVYSLSSDNEFGYEYELRSDGLLCLFIQHTEGQKVIQLKWSSYYCIFFADICYKYKLKRRNKAGSSECLYDYALAKESSLHVDYMGNILKSGILTDGPAEEHPEKFKCFVDDSIKMYKMFRPDIVADYNTEGKRGEQLYRKLFIDCIPCEERGDAIRLRFGSNLTDNYKQKLDSGEIQDPSFSYTIDHAKVDELLINAEDGQYIISAHIAYNTEHSCFILRAHRWKNSRSVYRFDLLDTEGKSILNPDLTYKAGNIRNLEISSVGANGRKIQRLSDEHSGLKQEAVHFYKQLYNKFNY